VALLSTPPAGEETALYLIAPGATALPAPAARFGHLPYASVQAAVVPGSTTVVAVADRAPGSDRSFASGLVRLAPGAEPVWLCDRVVMASRPLVWRGRVLVARGRAGAAPVEGAYRVDDLTIDEIDLGGGAPRTLHGMRGYLLYLVGVAGDEVLVYRVRPDGADIVALARDGRTRTVVPSLAPFARDFAVDAGSLSYENRHETDPKRWVVERVDVASGARQRVGDRHRGPGSIDRVVERDVGRAAVLRVAPSALPVPLLVEATTGAERRLPAPAGERVTIAGFVP
jgi:hypothetical protein